MVVYTLNQVAIISVVAQPSLTDRPTAAAVQVMLGSWAAAVVSIGVLISCYGSLSTSVLRSPRILFAMAEQGDMPPVMARVHPRFRTPHVAIVVFAILLYGFSVAGSFQWNLFVSAMARLIYFSSVAVALPVLRRKHEASEARFHLPMGWFFAGLAAATSLLLFPKLDRASLAVLGILGLCVIANTIWASRCASTTLGQPKE